MKSQHRRCTFLLCAATLTTFLANTPTFGHDPLREEHEPVHRDHHSGHVGNSRHGTPLSDVRELVVFFRRTGDDQYLDDAWALLETALAAGSADSETLIAASFVAQSRHEFEYAVQLINTALAINGNNDEAWLLLASIQMVRGETESAAAACRHLLNVPPLVLLTCNARVALATGDQQIAFRHLSSILKITDAQRLPAEVLAWSYSVAADLAVAAGETEHAITLYRRSLVLAERTQVRAALVDVLLLEAEYQAARRTLHDGSLALPLLVRRLIVAKHLGDLHELQPVLSKVQQEFAVWIAEEDWLHAREMARFYIDVLDQPDIARRLALINISLQKEPEDQRLVSRTRIMAGRKEKDAQPG